MLVLTTKLILNDHLLLITKIIYWLLLMIINCYQILTKTLDKFDNLIIIIN